MDKIGCNHNRPVVFYTNVTKNVWLTWLRLSVDMAFLIWFLIKFYIIYMLIYNDIMEL
jgi:hypothetical protein